jgi:four helix bundle protein
LLVDRLKTKNYQPTTINKKDGIYKLDVWVETRKLANLIYDATKVFPKEEIFGLVNQLRRCAVSVPSNIAEGCGRQTAKDTINFLHISRGSLYELETQCYLAFDQKYIDENNFTVIFNQIQTSKKLLNGFINYYKKI